MLYILIAVFIGLWARGKAIARADADQAHRNIIGLLAEQVSDMDIQA